MQDDSSPERIITFHTIDSKFTFRFSKETGFRRCPSSPSAAVSLVGKRRPDASAGIEPVAGQCSVCYREDCDLPTHQRRINAPKLIQSSESDEGFALLGNRAASPPPELGASSVDPFGRFPVKMSPEMQEAYRSFYVQWTAINPALLQYHLYPISRFSIAMATAQHDPASFMALLAVATIQSSTARSHKASALGIRLHRAAIQLQASACQRDGPTDARILSAMCILFSELALSGLDQVTPLFRTVTSLVSQRGGIQNLGMEGVIVGDLLVTDFAIALLKYIPPLLKLPRRIVDAPHMGASGLGAAFFALPISHSVLILLRDAACLLGIYNRACQGVGTPAESDYFAYLCELIEQRLAELNAAYKGSESLEVLLIYAVILIDLCILRFPGQLRGTTSEMERRFWKNYENLRAHSDLTSNHNLDVWLAFTGTIISVHRSSGYEDKAISILRGMVSSSGLPQDFSDLKSILDQYIWCEPAQTPSCRALLEKAVAPVSDPETQLHTCPTNPCATCAHERSALCSFPSS